MTIDEIIKAIDAEEELTGEMPDAMWDAINGDRDACTKSHRLAVKSTKDGIKKRILAMQRPTNLRGIPEDFKGSPMEALVARAGKLIECGFHVFTVRHKSTGEWKNILVLEDQTNQEFCHAFEFDEEATITLLNLMLQGYKTIQAQSQTAARA